MAAAGVLVVVPLIGVPFTAAGGLLAVACAPGWSAIGGWPLLALVPAALTLLACCVLSLLRPQRGPGVASS